jgi:hypothetical protein
VDPSCLLSKLAAIAEPTAAIRAVTHLHAMRAVDLTRGADYAAVTAAAKNICSTIGSVPDPVLPIMESSLTTGIRSSSRALPVAVETKNLNTLASSIRYTRFKAKNLA